MTVFLWVELIYLAAEPFNERKGFTSLISMVRFLNHRPYDGSLYIFTTRSKKILKILYYDLTEYCLFYKKLNEKNFAWKIREDGMIEISHEQLGWLLAGLQIHQKHALKKYIR